MTRANPEANDKIEPLNLPSISAWSNINLPDRTLIISAAGFEDRSFALARSLTKAATDVKALLITYLPYDPKNKVQELIDALRNKGVGIDKTLSYIAFNRFSPDEFADQLSQALIDLEPSQVILDTSSMSKMAILLALDVLRELDLETYVFYSEAREYGPSKGDYEKARCLNQIHQPSIQVYSGVGGVIRASRLSSVAMQGEPITAIMFMSFNELLTQALLNCVYPSRLFLINGKPPQHQWREDAMAWIHETLISEWPARDNPVYTRLGTNHNIPVRSTSTLYYAETVDVLIELYWRLSTNYRIIVAPTGSKMQTIGVFFARALHPDIHIEYPTPKGYLKLYSRGTGTKWLIHLGRAGSLVERLRLEERKRRLGLPSDLTT